MSNKNISTVSSVFLKILKKHGIKDIYCVPTIQLGMLMDGASRDSWFRYHTVRHEEASAHMCHGLAKTSGRIGVCLAAVGTGAASIAGGISAAYSDNVPMIVMTSNNLRARMEPSVGWFQHFEQMELLRPITKAQFPIRTPERAGEVFERAIETALTGRPGPVQVDVAFDVGLAETDYDANGRPVRAAARPSPSGAEFGLLVDTLRSAKRPLIIGGGGVVRSGGTDAFRALIAATGFPATTTVNGFGLIEHDAPNHIGSAGIFGGGGVVSTVRP